MKPRGWPDNVALLVVALAAGLGAGRLTSGPTDADVLVPIALCVVAGHLVTALMGRRAWLSTLAPVAGTVAVALTASWVLIPGATRHGLPTPTTWRFVVNRFEAAGTIIRAHPTPLPPVPSVVMVLAVAAGLATVLGCTLWTVQQGTGAASRRPLLALVPTFGLVCYTALLSSGVDRVAGALVYLGAALAFVVVAGRAPGTSVRGRGVASGLAASTLAVGVALAASTGLSGMQLSAFPQPVANGLAGVVGQGGYAGAPDLIDNLESILTNESHAIMFTATSPVPTYWQIGVLSSFDGSTWRPDAATAAAAAGTYGEVTVVPGVAQGVAPGVAPGFAPGARPRGSLPVLPQASPKSTYVAELTIGGLQSTLLPVPPTTTAVIDQATSQLVPAIGLVQPKAARPGFRYTAVAGLTNPAAAAAAAASAAASAVASADLAPYLALPQVPSRVVRLAHQIVAGVTGPFAQAAALAHFFDTGKFHYTLYPSVQPGESALVSFLFTTRAGFCQQFAGAYAVLARLDGLPTRLAIGFTTGTVQAGTYTVTGADAHVWPEVYLGPSAGWVSFEPTPGQLREPAGNGVVVGGRVTLTPGGSVQTGSTTPASGPPATPAAPRPHPSSGVKTHGGGAAQTPGSAGSSPKSTASSVSPGAVVLIVFGVLAALAVLDALTGRRLWRVVRRRGARLWRVTVRRWRTVSARLRAHPGQFHPAHDRGATAEVIARWEQAAGALGATRLARWQHETLTEHALRIGERREQPTTPSFIAPVGNTVPLQPEVSDAYRALVELATKASYGADPCSDDEAATAKILCEAVRSGLEN